MTASLGVATSSCAVYSQEGVEENLERVIDMADQAMYQAKQAGRDQVAVWK